MASAAVGASALAAVYHLDPGSPGVIWCPYRLLTGLACPGCGMTRAVHFLLHAEIGTAFSHNPLLFVAVPAALLFAAAPRWAGDDRGNRWRTHLGWAMLAVTLGFWVWRNTPWYPLARL